MKTNLIGKPAPDFRAQAVINGKDIVDDFTLSQFRGQKVIFFFYPLDFTFVCPTEILAFQTHLKEFEKRNTRVVACSVDSAYSHWAWLHTPRDKGGIQGVTYPLVSDLDKTISMKYGVLGGTYRQKEDGEWTFEGSPVAMRGLFLIDEEGIVQHEVINNLGLGRSVREALRMVDALTHLQKYGEVCPADWEEGQEALKPTFEGVAEYLSHH
ncbi:MAG: peroxiredoxin [Chlorobi bacterium]|nr:peroxiredoxin [Chlorobiota bacterium]